MTINNGLTINANGGANASGGGIYVNYDSYTGASASPNLTSVSGLGPYLSLGTLGETGTALSYNEGFTKKWKSLSWSADELASDQAIKYQISTDGTNWKGPDGNAGSWTNNFFGQVQGQSAITNIPSNFPTSQTIYIKLRMESNGSDTPVLHDLSVASASIDTILYDTTAPTINSNTLVKPNGGESWGGGTTQTISWNAGGATDPESNGVASGLATSPVTLYYSTNSDAGPWTVIDSTNTSPVLNGVNSSCTPFSGSDSCYTWKIPNNVTSTQMKVKIEFTDKAGNKANDVSDAVYQSTADSSAPTTFTIESSSPKSGVWKAASPTVDWTDSTDPDSGIDHYEIWMTQTVTPTYPDDFTKRTDVGSSGNISPSTVTLPLSGQEGTWYYFVRATNGAYDPANKATYTDTGYGVTTDGANEQFNTQDMNAYFKVDDSIPTGTITVKVANSTETDATSSPAIELSLTGSDGTGSGLSTVRFSNNNTFYCDPIAFSSSSPYSFNLTNECGGVDPTLTQKGTRTVYLKIYDGVGNISSVVSDTIVYDTNNPANPNLTSAVVQGTVVSGSTNTVRVTWQTATDPPETSETVSGIAGYRVYRSEQATSNFLEITSSLIPSGTVTYDDTQATDGVTYYYRVQSIDNADNLSNYSSETALSVSLTDLTAPSLVNNFMASGTASTSIGVSWNTTADNGTVNDKKAASYVTQRSKEIEVINSTSCTEGTYNLDGQYDALKTVPIGNVPETSGVTYDSESDLYSFGDSGRTLEKWYCYRAKAIDAAANQSAWKYFPARGNSAPSFIDQDESEEVENYVNLGFTNSHNSETVAPGDTMTVTFKVTDPEGYTDLQLESENPGSFALQTVKIQDGLMSPTLDATQISLAERVQDVTDGYTYTYEYEIPETVAYGTYTLTVRVKDRVGIDSSNHDINKVVYYRVKPAAPTALQATGYTSTQVNLTWTAPGLTENQAGLRVNDRYSVRRRAFDTSDPFTHIGYSNTNSYSNTGLTVGSNYEYQIVAYDVSNNIGASSTSSNAVPPAPASSGAASVKNASHTSIDLGGTYPVRYLVTWDAVTNTQVPDFRGYKLYRNENGGEYTPLTTIDCDSLGENQTYFLDLHIGEDEEISYQYKIQTWDEAGNEGEPTETLATNASTTPQITAQPTAIDSGVSWIKVSWKSNQSSAGLVKYKKNINSEYRSFAGDPKSTTIQDGDDYVHTVTIRGLEKGTSYDIITSSMNTSKILSAESNKLTASTKQFTISNIQKNITASGASISWNTGSVPSNAIVIYNKIGDGASSSTSDNPPKETMKTNHAVEIKDLTPGDYSFYVKSYDAEGNLAEAGDSNLYTFTITGFDTGTLSSPQAGKIEEQDITATSAKITWTSTVSTSSWVDYGTESKKYLKSTGSDTFTIDHIVTLEGLTPGQTYYYIVRGLDANDTEYKSQEYSFVALAKPNISSITISDVTSYTAKVRVTVTKDVEASVTFGNQGKFGSKAGSASVSKTHEIKLENLEDASTYTYYVDVKDSAGNTARSETKSFTTPMDKTGPVIEQVKIDILPLGESDEYAQAIISWSTDKPSSTKVEYDEGVVGGKYAKSSIEDESLNNSHTVIVKDLNPASSYHFRIVSRDKRSNETKSNDYNFVTPTKEKSILQLILKSLEETFSWVSNVGSFFRGLGKKG